MKKFVLWFICMFVMVSVFAQTNFQELTLVKALEKAKSENKKVFVDCYTSWCGPCKMMATKILPLKEVGKYMNENFVCVKFDMEKGEGRDIQAKYRVSSYPTFLILNPDGSLLYAVVGATATGDEFLNRVKEAFDENSAGNLATEYEKGNRDMAFLEKYIQALLKTYDVEKAQKIAQDILASLDDEEKCSTSFWYIFGDQDLSPAESGNVAYLLKHVDKFRQNVGVERVDSVLAGLFEIQLEDILRGRNKTATIEDVEATKKMLDSYHLTGQDYLYDYIALIKAVKSENTAETLTLYKKIFPKLSDGKIAYLYFTPMLALKDKWTGEQKKELIDLTNRLAEQIQMSQLKVSIKQFADGAIAHW